MNISKKIFYTNLLKIKNELIKPSKKYFYISSLLFQSIRVFLETFYKKTLTKIFSYGILEIIRLRLTLYG